MDAWVQESAPHADCGCLTAEEIDAQASDSERVLLWLLQHPFQCIEDIALPLGWHRASIYRRIAKLEKQGMVETIHDPCSVTKSCSLYVLSSPGITAVADMRGIDANSLMAHWRYRERDILALLPRLSTQRVLQYVINSLVTKRGDMDISGARTTTWKWIPAYRLESIPTMKEQTSIADALVIFSESRQAIIHPMRLQAAYQSFLVLVDPGFAGERDRDLIRRRVETLHLSSYRQKQLQPDRKYPSVLIVTPSQENGAIWTQLLHEAVGGQAPCLFSGAMSVCAYDELLLAHHSLPWKQISDGCSCDPIQMLSSSVYWEPPPMSPPSGSGVRSVFRGHFMERSQMDRGSNHSEREALGLLALRLHRRHLDVLQMVYQHPLLSREEIAEVLILRMICTTHLE